MNVFVLCTGRSGSTTFTRACRHLTNYTSGHETRFGRLGDDRLEYPLDHIEADNRLSWLLGRLDRAYGDSAFYVHLRRDPEETARSFDKRWGIREGILSAYDTAILLHNQPGLDVCRDLVDTVNSNIELFLRNKTQTMTIELREVDSQFPVFLDRIDAEGDLDAAMGEWVVQHNASREPPPKPPFSITRAARKGSRALRGLPDYLRDA